MAGLILIEDPTDWSVPWHIRRVSCPLHCEHDIQLIFQAQLAYQNFGFSQAQRTIKDNLFMYQFRSYFCLYFSSFLFILLAVATDSSFVGRIVRYLISVCFWRSMFSYVNMDSCSFANRRICFLSAYTLETSPWQHIYLVISKFSRPCRSLFFCESCCLV